MKSVFVMFVVFVISSSPVHLPPCLLVYDFLVTALDKCFFFWAVSIVFVFNGINRIILLSI